MSYSFFKILHDREPLHITMSVEKEGMEYAAPGAQGCPLFFEVGLKHGSESESTGHGIGAVWLFLMACGKEDMFLHK